MKRSKHLATPLCTTYLSVNCISPPSLLYKSPLRNFFVESQSLNHLESRSTLIMGADKDKQKSKRGSRKEKGDTTPAESEAAAIPQPPRTSTNESTKSGRPGKLSAGKLASAVFSNMTITPKMRSSGWKTAQPSKRSEKATEESAKAKATEPARSASMPERDIIEIKIGQECEPETPWIIFTVPFDRKNRSEAVRWNGSEGYTFRESIEWRHPRVTYLNGLLPPNPDPVLQKKDLAVFFHILAPLKSIQGQIGKDVRGALGTILRMSKFVSVSVRLYFDEEFDPALKSEETQAAAADVVQKIITKLQDEEEATISEKKAKKTAVLAEPLWVDIAPRSHLGVDYQSSVARCYESAATRKLPSSVTRDFAHEGSSRVSAKKPTQRTLAENAEDMKNWLEKERSHSPEAMSDEDDDAILPDPK